MGNLIAKDNALIEASHKLGETEQRLILLAILEARKHCTHIEELKGKELIIHADDYAKTFGINQKMAYKALKQAVMGLFEAKWGYKHLNAKGNKVVHYERFTQSAMYVEGEGLVSFKFADAIIPMLVELEKRFTVYEIEQIAQLSSSYAMRLYEFFMQYFNKQTGSGWLEISLEDLRFRFGLLPNEYKLMSDFKKRVLDYSVKEINKNTDLIATYTQKKKGRVIVGFCFEFVKKTNPNPLSAKNKTKKKTQEPDPFAEFSEIERAIIQARINEHIARLEAKGTIIDDFHRQNIANKAIAERWGLDALDKEQERQQKAKEQKLIERIWRKTPVGTRFVYKKTGDVFVKDYGEMMKSEKDNKYLTEQQVIRIFDDLEEIDEI